MIARLLLLSLLASPVGAQQVVFVNHTATGASTGASWQDAFTDLQSTLTAAQPGTRIFVASGTYFPTTGASRSESFQLKTGVEVYGGFSGTETALQERDWRQHETILSGDIGVPGQAADNSYHVVVGSGTDWTAVLDGFIVENGNANGNPEPLGDAGGGMFNRGGSPTVANVIFRDNFAPNGAGVMNRDGASPSFVNVLFHGNLAGHNGGAAANVGGTNPEGNRPMFVNCTFSGNVASAGGAVYNSASTVTVRNSILWGNGGGEIVDAAGGSTIVYRAIVQGGYPGGAHVLNMDPQFLNPHAGDFRLLASSPALNFGDVSLLPRDWRDLDGDGNTAEPIPFDLAGRARVWASSVDLGAFEYSIEGCPSGRLHVNKNAPSGGNGATWSSAVNELVIARELIGVCGFTGEVWVATGTYTPSSSADQEASFHLSSGLAYYGGFTGTETERDQRDWRANPTILSGHLGGPSRSRVVVQATAADSTARLDGFIITGAFGSGFNVDGGSPVFENIEVRENARGGRVSGNATIRNAKFTLNRFPYGEGAGLLLVAGNSIVEHAEFLSNYGGLTMSSGTAISVSGGVASIRHVTISNPDHPPSGFAHSSAVMVVNATADTHALTIRDSRCSVRCGIELENATFLADSLTIDNNESILFSTLNGLAVYGVNSSIRIRNASITNNRARGHICNGLGAYVKGGSLVLDRVQIRGNEAIASGSSQIGAVANGIAVFAEGAAVIIRESSISENTGSRALPYASGWVRGGGIFNLGSTLHIINSKLVGNAITEPPATSVIGPRGGALYAQGGTTYLINTLVAHNSAMRGGAVYAMATSALELVNVTLAQNSADVTGGVHTEGTLKIANSILYDNQGAQIAGAASPITVAHSLVQGGHPGTEVLDADPRFVDAAAGDYRLHWSSPAIDVGNNAFLPDSITVDLDGNPRIQGSAVDLGAYESPYTVSVEPIAELPLATELGDAYPNPFASATMLPFSLAAPAHVRLAVFDVLGRRIAVLKDEHLAAGRYTLAVESASLASGTYLVRMEAGDTVQTRRIVLVR